MDRMTLSVHSVVKLHIKFAKGVQQHTLAVGGEGGEGREGVIMTRGTQGCNL